jgi:hypothetical protein
LKEGVAGGTKFAEIKDGLLCGDDMIELPRAVITYSTYIQIYH